MIATTARGHVGLFLISVACCLCAIASAVAMPAIERSMRQERVGLALFRPGSDQIVFEQRRAYEDLPAGAYRSPVVLVQWVTSILTFSTGDDRSARPLFPARQDALYKLISFSPDGRRLLFVEKAVRDNLNRIGIYDFKTDRVTTFDLNPYLHPNTGIGLEWVSGETVLFIANPIGTQWHSADAVSGGLDAVHSARKAAWANTASSADVVGGGRYADLSTRPRSRRLMLLDVPTGQTREIGVGDYRRFVLSPDKRHVAATRTSQRLVPPTEFWPLPLGSDYRAHDLVVYDLTDGRAVRPCQPCDVPAWVLYWAPSGDRILFYSRARGERDGYYYTYRLSDGTLRRLSTDLEPATGWFWGVPERHRTAAWIGETPLVRQPSDGEGRHDWFTVPADGRRRNLTASFDQEPSALVATGRDHALFLSQGRLFRVGLDGAPVALTSQTDGSLVERVKIDSATGLLNNRADRLFLAEQDGDTLIQCFDQEYALRASLPFPDQHTQIMGASGAACAVVHAAFKPAAASRVVYRGHKTPVPREAFRFNRHLDGGPGWNRMALRVSYTDEDGTGEDGQDHHSWLFVPTGSTPDRRLPMVVIPYPTTSYGSDEPHGGFADSPWTIVAHSPVSVSLYVDQGYAVLLPSVRQAHERSLAGAQPTPTDVIARTVPYVMSAVEQAVATGYVDDTRIALSGHSWGGAQVVFVASQTDRFKAVVAHAGPMNETSSYGAYGPHHAFGVRNVLTWGNALELPIHYAAPPWRDPERYRRNSAITYIDRVTAPVMLISADLDSVSIAQSEEAFSALYRQNKDVLFVRYWGESHVLWSPANRRDMWARIFRFLADSGVAP